MFTLRHDGPRFASDLLERCSLAERRIREGIDLLKQPVVLDAFRIANRAMARAARQRNAQIQRSPQKRSTHPPGVRFSSRSCCSTCAASWNPKAPTAKW